eukprot:jgi/Mesvir1/26441/Mv16124-RA.4
MCLLRDFALRLQQTEAQLAPYRPVDRLQECPPSLDPFCNSYEGAPVVFPSWHAPWQQELAVDGDDPCALMRALGTLLGDDAQVEAFLLKHDEEESGKETSVDEESGKGKRQWQPEGAAQGEETKAQARGEELVEQGLARRMLPQASGVAGKEVVRDGEPDSMCAPDGVAGIAGTLRWHPIARSERRRMPFSRFAQMAVAAGAGCSDDMATSTGQVRDEPGCVNGPEDKRPDVSNINILSTSEMRMEHGDREPSAIDSGMSCGSRENAKKRTREEEPPPPAPQLIYLTWRDLPAPGEELSGLPPGLQRFFAKLLHPATTPPLIPAGSVRQRNLWMGTSATSRIHFDALDNLHILLAGRKVFHLYPPTDIGCIYPEPWTEGSLNNFSALGSVLLLLRPKATASQGTGVGVPPFRQKGWGDPRWEHFDNAAHGYRAEVTAGEAIFIPRGWWHEVRLWWQYPHAAC